MSDEEPERPLAMEDTDSEESDSDPAGGQPGGQPAGAQPVGQPAGGQPVGQASQPSAAAAHNSSINIKIKNDSDEIYFKLGASTSFSRLFQAYALKIGRDFRDIRFFYDGNPVPGDATAATLAMNDGDYVYTVQAVFV